MAQLSGKILKKILSPTFLMKSGFFALCATFFLFGGVGMFGGQGIQKAEAASCVAGASGNWSNTSTVWTGCAGGGNSKPSAGDTIQVNSGVALVVDENTLTVGAITIVADAGASGTNRQAITVNTGVKLTSSGTLTINGPTTTTNTTSVTLSGTGALEVGALTFGTGATNRNITLAVGSGTLTVNGNITAGSGGTRSLTTSGAATLNWNGTTIPTGLTWTMNSLSTTNFTGTSAINGAYTFGNVDIDSGTTTLGAGTITFASITNIRDGATLQLGNFAFTQTSTINIGQGTSGILNGGTGSTGSYTFSSFIIVNAGGVFNLGASSGTHAVVFSGTGGHTHNGTTFSTGTGSLTLSSTGAFPISGNGAMSYGNTLSIPTNRQVTVSNTNTVTFGALTMATAASVNSFTINDGSNVVVTNALTFSANASATTRLVTLGSGAGAGNLTVGSITMTGGNGGNSGGGKIQCSAGGTGTLTVSGAGTITITGSSTASNTGLMSIDMSAGACNVVTGTVAGTVLTLAGGTTGASPAAMFKMGTGTATLNGNLVFSGGTAGKASFNMGSSGGTLVLNGATLPVVGTAGSYTFTSTTNITSTGTSAINYVTAISTIGALTVNSGTLTFAAAPTATSVTVASSATLALGANLLTNTGNLTCGSGGSGTATISGSGGITMSAASASMTLSGGAGSACNITNNGLFTISGATAPSFATDSNYTIAGAVSVTNAAATLTNNGSVTITGTLTLTGNWTQGAADSLSLGAATAIAGAGTFDANSGADNTVTYTAASPTCKVVAYQNLTFTNATGASTVSCAVTTVNGNLTVSTAGTSQAWTLGAALTVGGTFTVGASSTVTTANFTLGVTGATTIAGTLSHAGNAALSFADMALNGTLSNTTTGSGTITATGNITGSGTVTLNNATAAGTFIQRVAADKTFGSSSGSNTWSFYHLKFENSNGVLHTVTPNAGTGTIQVDGTLTIGNAGDGATTAFDNNTANDRIFDLNGTASINITSKGSFTASNTASFTVAGNFTNSGTFTAPTNSTITFDTTADSTLSGNTTFYNFTATTNGKTLKFTSGQTFITNGLLTLTNVTVNSSDGSTQWFITHNGTESVTSITISNSGCTASTDITTTSSTDSGNNGTCWKNLAQPVTVSGIVYLNDETTAYDTVTAMKLSKNGGTAVSTNSVVTTGAFSFTVAGPVAGDIITIWLDTNGVGSVQGSLVFKYGASCTGYTNCTGLKVVRDQVRIQNFNTGNIANTDLAACDNDSGAGCADTDIGFTANAGVLTTTWTTNEIGIVSGTTFAPGNTVTAKELDVAGTYLGGTETLTLSGAGTSLTCTNAAQVPLCVTGTFTPTSNTTIFSGSATNIGPATFNNLTFSGAATYTLGTTTGQTITVGGNLIIGTGGATVVNVTTQDPILDVNGNVSIATSATLSASNTSSFTIGGNFANSGTFTNNGGTVTFDATDTDNTITGSYNLSTNEFKNITFNGSGGQWDLNTATQLYMSGMFTVTLGTVTTTTSIYASGCSDGTVGFTGAGTLTMGTGTALNINCEPDISNSGNWTLYNLNTDNPGSILALSGSGTLTISNVITLGSASDRIDAGSKTIILTKTGTGQIVKTGGTFNFDTSTIRYTGNGATNIDCSIGSYYNLEVQPGGAVTHTLCTAGSQTLTATGSVTFGDGSSGRVVTAATYNPTINIAGNLTINNNTTYTKGTGTTTFNGATTASTITDSNASSQNLGVVVTNKTSGVGATDTVTLASNIKLDTLTIGTGDTWNMGSGSYIMEVANAGATATVLTNNGTFTAGTSTVNISATNSGGNITVPALTFSSLTLSGAETYAAASGTLTIGGTLTVGTGSATTFNLDINDPTTDINGNVTIVGSGVLVASATATTTIAGNFTNSGTFTHSNGNVTFDTTGTTVITGSTTFYSLTATTSTKIIQVDTNTTITTASGGVLTLTGVTVTRETGDSGSWTINHQGTESITNTTVSWSACDGASTEITALTSSGNVDGGNNGICWIFAAGITISGNAYDDEATGDLAICNGSTQNISMKVGSQTLYNTTCADSGNAFTFSGVTQPSAGDIITIFMNTNGGSVGTLVDRYDGAGDVTGLFLRKNRLIVMSDNATAITNTNLDNYDSTSGTNGQDSDVVFDVSTGSLVVEDGIKLIVLSGTNYTPGGSITTSTSNDGTDSNVDGDFDIQAGATVNVSTSAVSIGGDFNNLGTYTTFLNTTTFTATATGHTITAGTHTLYGVTFNGAGGDWSFTDAVVIGGTLTITAGTLSGTNNITLQSSAPNVTGAGTINLTGGTFYFKLGTSSSFGSSSGSNNWTFFNLNFENIDSANRSVAPRAGGSGSVIVSNVLTIGNAGNTYSSTLNLDTNDRIFDINGDVVITSKGLLTASNSASFTVSGNWTNNGTFTGTSGSTITFDSVSGGKTLSGTLNGGSAFYNLVFDGVSGGWSNSTALLVGNNLSINNGTLDNSTADITVTGNVSVGGTLQGTGNFTVNGGGVTGNGTINMTSGTFLVDGTGNFGGGTAWVFNNLTFGDGSGATTVTGTGIGGITINNTLTVALAQILNGGTNTWILPATGTSFVVTGTFTGGSSTVSYRNATSATVTTANYYNLDFSPASGTPTYTLSTGSLSIGGDLTIGGAGSATVTATANDPTLSISGNVTIGSGDTFVASDLNDFSVGGSWSNSGTFTPSGRKVTFTATSGTKTIDNGASQFYDLELNGSGGTFQPSNNAITIANDLTCTAGTLSGTLGITVNGGDVTGNCTINMTGGTFTVDGASGTGFGGATTWTFNNLSFTGASSATTATGAGGISIGANGVLTIGASHTLNAGSKTWTLSSTGTPLTRTGTLAADTSTFIYTSAGATALSSAAMTDSNAFYDLTINGSGTINAGVAITAKNNLTVTGGTLALGTNNLIVGDTANSNSGSIKVASSQGLTQSSSATTTVLSSAAGANCIGSSGALCTGTAGTITLGSLVIGNASTAFTTTVGATSPTITIVDALTITTNAELNAGTSTLAITGNGTVLTSNGTFTASTSTVALNSTSTTGTTVPALTYYNLTLNRASNTFTGTNSTIVQNNFTITAGTFTAPAGNFTVGGNFTNNGTFSHNNGTVLFNSGSKVVTIGGSSISFYNVTATTPGKTLKFTNGNTFTFNGTLTVTGSDGSPIELISDSNGVQWTFYLIGSKSISYINVKDSACHVSSASVAASTSINNGGNNGSCWGFIQYGGGGAYTGGGGSGSSGLDNQSGGGAGTTCGTASGTVTVSNGVVTTIVVVNGGGCYTAVPVAVICGGGGAGAVLTAVLTNGVVTSVTVDIGGSGYGAPTVVFGNSPDGLGGGCPQVGGGGGGGGGGSP